LKSRDFKDIVVKAVDYTFTNEETKKILKKRIQAQLSEIL